MSKQNGERLDADAIKAQMQMDDLGDVNRDTITTVDPGFRQTNLRRELGMRECNDPSTAAGQKSMANRSALAGWGNLANAERRAGIHYDDEDGKPMADGQSHRPRLRTNVETLKLQGEDGEIPEHPAATSLFNRNGPRHYRNTIPREQDFTGPEANARYQDDLLKSHQAASTRGTSHNMNGGARHDASAPTHRSQQIHRPPPQSQTKSTNGKQKHTSPSRKDGLQNAGANSLPNSQFTEEQLKLARSMSETRSKNLSDASNTVGKNVAKRGPQHSVEPNRSFKSVRTNGSNVGVRRGGAAGQQHRNVVPSSRAQLTRPITRSLQSNGSTMTATPGQGWTGQLVENPPFVAPPKPIESPRKRVNGESNAASIKQKTLPAVKKLEEPLATPPAQPADVHTEVTAHQNLNAAARNPAELCSDEFLRAHPALAHLYAPGPVLSAPTQTQNLTPAAITSRASHTTTQSAPQIGSLIDTVNEREMGNLSSNFAAMTLTPRPTVPTTGRGIMASSHAVAPSPPRSTTSVAPSVSTSHSIYVEATSSADNFWKWKETQVPNRSGP